MRRFAFAALLLFLVSCTPEREQTENFTVVATFYPIWLAAENITHGVDGVSLKLLTSPHTGCLHDYQLTPGELESIKGADLVLALGEMENFLDRVKQSYPNISINEIGDPDNEHCWVYVRDYIKFVNRIGSAIISADMERSGEYERNIQNYLEELSLLALELESDMQGLDGVPIIMFHEGFEPWEDAYGLNIVATVESEPGVEPAPREFADLLDLALEKGVKAVFTEPQYSGASAYTVAREIGARIYEIDSVSSGPEDKDFYRKAMRRNAETFRAALGDE